MKFQWQAQQHLQSSKQLKPSFVQTNLQPEPEQASLPVQQASRVVPADAIKHSILQSIKQADACIRPMDQEVFQNPLASQGSGSGNHDVPINRLSVEGSSPQSLNAAQVPAISSHSIQSVPNGSISLHFFSSLCDQGKPKLQSIPRSPLQETVMPAWDMLGSIQATIWEQSLVAVGVPDVRIVANILRLFAGCRFEGEPGGW
uniref:Uncharacterized protein n=1 Tax=Ditylenchus dipsaci TaxID=166011 RepID=A0A915CWY7_9BILA